MKPIIHVEGVGKQYRIGSHEAAYRTLRESLMHALKFEPSAKPEYMWALQDISFQAAPGEVIGVIGRNGAGKSTLLKILSRITEPTTGRIDLYGRVGSLLEVGTGFHPELTGRENIFLNGAILGMRARGDPPQVRRDRRLRRGREVHRHAGQALLQRHVSCGWRSPSRRISSRKSCSSTKCSPSATPLSRKNVSARCGDVSAQGRTVLFVSHNMAAIESLCNRCLLILEGRLTAVGTPHELVTKYLAAESLPENSSRDLSQHPGRRGGMAPIMRSVSLRSQDGLAASTIRMGEGVTIRLDFDYGHSRIRPFLNISIKNNYGVPILTASTRIQNQFQFHEPVSAGSITCHLRDLPLLQGSYSIDLFLSEEYQNNDVVYDAISFEVVEADVFGTGQVPPSNEGSIFWSAEFEMCATEATVNGR